ncbi:uncharacterized protein LOC111051408 isoform X1 [Nilaparvata lugens]|uniref:uncharacterized protein LOC111051408 isoform X1 n=1 Tax=Nilaparvata lugens TaxID=108931 RepID=UPI000B97FE67|nr:uncharacterized protein LOC111051408 isoform X1 [Nilaparvata lugens]
MIEVDTTELDLFNSQDQMQNGIVTDNGLRSVKGIKFKEEIISDVVNYTTKRHFGVQPCSSNESEPPLGPLVLFTFIAPTRTEKIDSTYKDLHHALKAALQSNKLQNGLLLDTREKGVLFPVVHFSEDRESLKTCLSDEHTLGEDFVLHQGVYREVRSIKPEGCQIQNGGSHVIPSAHIGYILLGFKSLDKNFDQVMVDSWKDWTGARHIYMYLPDELGLARISFYHREAPDSLNMFMYLVLVECHNITNRERQIRLLDFAQRMRVERMSGYISVYGQTSND